MFQTGSVIFEKRQRRYQILKDIETRHEKEMKGGAQPKILGLRYLTKKSFLSVGP